MVQLHWNRLWQDSRRFWSSYMVGPPRNSQLALTKRLHEPHMEGTLPCALTLTEDAYMRTHRFGTKIKLPSTVAIKHQLLTMMLEDEVRATPAGVPFNERGSRALGMLRRPVVSQKLHDRAG